jgi:hypothetical protein
VERGSDLHGARLDDALKHETDSLTSATPIEARAEDAREMELEREEEATVVPEPDAREFSTVLPHDEVVQRAELARRLRPSVFPARTDEVIACARQEGASPELLDRLGRIDDSLYDNVEQVWQAMGGGRELRPRPD